MFSDNRALKMPRNDMCFTEIGKAVLEIFRFRGDILRKGRRIRISPDSSIKNGER